MLISVFIQTLNLLGISNPLSFWLSSYLSNRHLYISIHGSFLSVFTSSSVYRKVFYFLLTSSTFLSILLLQFFGIPNFSCCFSLMILNYFYDLNSDCQHLQQDLNNLVASGEFFNLFLNIPVFSFLRLHSSISLFIMCSLNF